jgi:glyoxylase-like metal-dependent hydrolase (beta-lactamase superfamily II)
MDDPFPRGIVRVPVLFVNAYLVDVTPTVPADGWALVDTGLATVGAAAIQRAVERRYGRDTRPRAIVLTHGHFDHAGSAAALARRWRVPVFAHRLELPYLVGRSDYPPPDPTVGGALAMLSRVFPRRGIDLDGLVRPLPIEEAPALLRGWRIIHTPGHTPGHVSLWREFDRVLIAGDALATMNQESWTETVRMRRELRHPPAPLTTDWDAARASLGELAGLRPRSIVAGHGRPVSGPLVADALQRLADVMQPPRRGRYAQDPVEADERGVLDIPPPVADPLGWVMRAAAASAAVGVTAGVISRARRRAATGRQGPLAWEE